MKSTVLPSLGLALAAACGTTAAHADTLTGVSSSQSPYLLPASPKVATISLLTVGDSVNVKPDAVSPYRMVGLPDGLGAFDNGDGTFTVLMNHEIAGGGIVRASGLAGSFVSKWIVERKSLTVLHGEDLTKRAYVWDGGKYVLATTPFSRFCSAALGDLSAFYDRKSGLGYPGRIFMNGEESGTEGRAFAHLLNGDSFELPSLGKLAWENAVPNPSTGTKTVVAGTDDGTGGQVYIYVGDKTDSTHPVEAAGLKGGTLYGIRIAGFAAENSATGIPSGTAFTGVSLGNVTGLTGAQLESASAAAGITNFLRPEDSAWDPQKPNDLYFVTTASFTGRSRLWRLRFTDAADPAAGGRIDMLLDGTEGPKMMDNIAVAHGQVMIQEDPGNQSYLAKVWQYDIRHDRLSLVAEHDAARFVLGGASFLTQDEESSGIISLGGILGPKWYLAAVQAHYANGPELVEGGQLLAIHLEDEEGDDRGRDDRH